MKNFFKLALEFRAAWHLAIEYRIAVFIWMFSMALPLIMMAAWLSIAEEGPVVRFSREDFIAYYLAAVLIRNLTGVWIIWEQDADIRYGNLSFRLLKPMNPIFHYIALSWGSKPLRLLIVAPMVLVGAYAIPGVDFVSDPLKAGLFIVSIIATWGILFLLQYTTGLLGFWITQATNLHDVWFAVFSLCSGFLIPLELFPPVVRDLLYFTPFPYMLSFPAEIFTDQLEVSQIAGGLAVQWAWVAAFYGLYRFVWSRGLKRYSAVGA